MRRVALVAWLLTAAAGPVAAQLPGVPGTSPFARDYRVDLAIPEAPALQLLGGETGTLLRPGLPSEITALLSRFVSDGQLRLPESIGIELSPGLLIAGPRLDSASYRRQKLIHATRFSAATSTATDGVGRDMALGLRLGLVNDADLRLDAAFADDTTLQITPILTRINQIHSAALERLGPPGQRTGPPGYTKAELDEIAQLSGLIRDRWAERHWNARAIDIAVGMRASALDDQGTDTRITAFGAWTTFAQGFGDWGQLLVGGRAAAERGHGDSDYAAMLGLGLRLYIGGNALKAFIEVQDELREGASAEILVNSGAEIRVADWIWGTAGLGLVRSAGTTTTRTSFRFNTMFPRL